MIQYSTIKGQTEGYPISSTKPFVPTKTAVTKPITTNNINITYNHQHTTVSTLQPTASSSNILSEFSHYSLLTNSFSSSPNTRSSSSVILSVPQKISSSRSIKISTSSSTTISLDIINLLSNSSLGTKVSSKSPNQITFTQYSAQDTTIYRSGKYLTMELNDNGKVILYSSAHNIDHQSFLYLYILDDKVGTPIYSILGVGSFILIISIFGLVLIIRKKRNARIYNKDNKEKGYCVHSSKSVYPGIIKKNF